MRQSFGETPNKAHDELMGYQDEILKREQEIKDLAILKLRKMESMVRTKDAQIADLESQVDTLQSDLHSNIIIHNFHLLCLEMDQKVNQEYQQKFIELQQLFDEKDTTIDNLVNEHNEQITAKDTQIDNLSKELQENIDK